MNIFLEMLVEMMRQTQFLQQLVVGQEATNAKLDEIIRILTPPEVAAIKGVYGTPKQNKEP